MGQQPTDPTPLEPHPGCLLSGLIALSEVAAYPVNLLVRGKDATPEEIAELAAKRNLSPEECRYRHYTRRQLRIESVVVAFCAIPWLSHWADGAYPSPFLTGALMAVNGFVIVNTFFVSFAYVLPHSGRRVAQVADLSRALMINMASFCANIFAFGYIYSHLNIHGSGDPQEWIDPFYFSVKSALTVGYGDLTPQDTLAKSVAMVQSLVSFVFSLVILGRIISSIPAMSAGQPGSGGPRG